MYYGKVKVDYLFDITTIYTAHRHRYPHDHSFPGESHNFWEIVIVLDGQIGVTAGHDVLLLGKGQAILHEPMEFHRLWSEGNSSPDVIIISFTCKNMPKLKTRLFKINSANRKEVASLLKHLRRIFTTDDVSLTGISDPDSFDYQIATKQLEIFLLKILSENITEVIHSTQQSAKNYTEIINVLENNLDKRLSISEIANLCKMSEVNLKKTFHKYSGTGIISYYNQLKMNEAVSMLRSGMSVSETALALGYTDQNYFSATFKRIVGKNATEIKNKYQF